MGSLELLSTDYQDQKEIRGGNTFPGVVENICILAVVFETGVMGSFDEQSVLSKHYYFWFLYLL